MLDLLVLFLLLGRILLRLLWLLLLLSGLSRRGRLDLFRCHLFGLLGQLLCRLGRTTRSRSRLRWRRSIRRNNLKLEVAGNLKALVTECRLGRLQHVLGGLRQYLNLIFLGHFIASLEDFSTLLASDGSFFDRKPNGDLFGLVGGLTGLPRGYLVDFLVDFHGSWFGRLGEATASVDGGLALGLAGPDGAIRHRKLVAGLDDLV